MGNLRLGVNLDHVATIRQARFTPYPDVMEAVRISERAGADGITLHLREDRRHIQPEDVYAARRIITTSMNLEMAATEAMGALAIDLRPDYCCIVPERREELTTEGGLDLAGNKRRLTDACRRLAAAGIKVSLFIEPTEQAIDLTREIGAPIVELHTGVYADATGERQARELERLTQTAAYAANAGLQVNAGHGLHYANVGAIAAIPQLKELNIGHAIVARALFVGLHAAVDEMKQAMAAGRGRQP
ncbi:MAG: pyridoxine 5'-phosphate synthase [Gammaproteobacteria bacterium]